MMKKCIIYFIRHATPDWSQKDLSYFVPPGPQLTKQGEKEALELGDYLKETDVEYLIVSPLERCQQTAEIVSERTGLLWKTNELLREWEPEEDINSVETRIRKILSDLWNNTNGDCSVGLIFHGGPIAVGLEVLGMDENEISDNRIYDHRNPLPPGGVWLAKCNNINTDWEFDLVFKPKGFRDQ
jgi:broad specificity phosphatase PhoE